MEDLAAYNRKVNDDIPVATKDNFWDYLGQQYPKTYAKFSKWVDEYKKRNDWNKLFNAKTVTGVFVDTKLIAPKVHELPMAMQFGIVAQFAQETAHKALDFAPDMSTMESWGQGIDEWFKIEESLNP